MKISRFGLLLAWAACLPLIELSMPCSANDEAPAANNVRPVVHNVLRDGPTTASSTENQPSEKQDAEKSAGTTEKTGEKPKVSQAGPALVSPKTAETKPAVTKKVETPAKAIEAKPTTPAITPDVKKEELSNTLREGTTAEKSTGEKLTTSPPLAAPTDAAAKPVTTPDATSTKQPATRTPGSKSAASTPTATAPRLLETAPQADKAAPGGRTAVISDTPAVQGADGRRPNTLLNADGEESGKKANVANQPVDGNSKKLFESTEAKPLTPEMEVLRKRVQSTLSTFYHNWTLNTYEHSPWEVMHAIIAYGVDTRLRHNGQNTTAIGHLCFSGIANKLPIISLRNDQLYVLRGPGVQGHSGQFLAILAQSHLQRDYPLYVAGKQYTLEDLIKAEQLDCESGTELTFKLIGLMHYLPSDATWTNSQGQNWSIDRLVREEIVQPVRGAACGGTHRLMGLSYAVGKREQRGLPIDGIYREAEKYIDQYHKYTFGLQNPDGSFSTAWFVRREARIDLDRRLQTTGHILEWLCFSLSDEQLRDPRVVRSVKYVTDLLINEKDHAWEIGHLGHALHALQLYNERVFGGPIRSYEGLVMRRSIKTAQRQDSGTSSDEVQRAPITR